MKLIVGLGNPGKKYDKTRHNMGFMAIDLLADQAKIDIDKEVFHALLGRGKIYNEDVILFKPQTFMNLSVEPGRIRIRKEGSSGGHKGMQNIIDCFSTVKIKRIRICTGEPGEWDTVDFVLSKPLKDEQPLIDEAIENAVGALKEAIKSDFDRAMNKFN